MSSYIANLISIYIIVLLFATTLLCFLPSGARKEWDYIAHEFYHPIVHQHPELNHYLERSLEHLQRIVAFPDGWEFCGVKLARVKSLLGKPYDEVSGDYQTTYDHSEPGFRRIKVAEQAGWYHGTQGRREQAKQWFTKVVEESRSSWYKPTLAYKGQLLVEKRIPFYR